MRLKRLLLALPLLLLAAARAGEPTQEELLSNPPGVKLELTTEKLAYRRGELVRVTVTLRNVGQEVFLASPEVALASDCYALGKWSPARLRVEVTDPKGKPPWLKHRWVGCRVWKTEQPLREFIQSTRARLSAGDSRSYTHSLQDFGYDVSKPGRYRLRATYQELSYKDGVPDAEFEDAKKSLPGPWWAKLESEWVEIEIRRD